MKSLAHKLAIATLLITLSSCSSTHTAITKRNLEVKTQMSETIFLEPVSPDKQVVYVQVRNTSGMPDLNIAPEVITAITANGYRITDNPDNAYYLLQANILQAGKLDNTDELAGGYGEAITTGVMGAAIGGLANDSHGALAGAAAGAAIGMIADALVKDVTYSIITDVQISERAKHSIRESTSTTLSQGNIAKNNVNIHLDSKNDTLQGKVGHSITQGSGSSTVTSQEYMEDTDWKKYRTRVSSYANKVNLKFEEAEPQLVNGLVHSLAGIF